MDSKVTMLAVGQGAMNLIEIYDVIAGRRVLVNLSLIDCGSIDGHRASQAACERALGYAAEKMRERFKQRDGVLLDNLLITHGDGDHWNMLDRLFRKAIGVGIILVAKNENVRYWRNEITEGYTETYYANIIDGILRYEKDYYGEFTLELSISYMLNELVPIVELLYEYEYNYIDVYWKPEDMEIVVLNEPQLPEEKGPWNILRNCCDNGNYIIYINNEKIEEKIPSNYEEFMTLYKEIYLMIKEYIIDIPNVHDLVFKEFLSTPEITYDEILKVVSNVQKERVPFIQNVYIGGNPSSYGRKFSEMVYALEMCAQNDVIIKAEKGKYIDLYGGFQLYVIENLAADMLERVINAESEDTAGIKNNATSMVSVLLLNGVPEFDKIIFTGDATVHTFYQILLDMNGPIIYENAVWTAPHHGAYRTIRGHILQDGEKVEVFLALLGAAHPIKMVVSAGVSNMHGHPCKSFVKRVFAYFEHEGMQVIPHDIYRNKNNSNKAGGAEWVLSQTDCPLYTTFTVLENRLEGYMDYAFSFPPQNAVPAENMLLLENRAEPAGRVFDSTAIPVKAEIPSKNMFFHR